MLMLALKVPCMPSMPNHNGSVPGNAPSPIRDVVTGICAIFASLVTWSDARDRITPPPANTTGRLAALIISTTLWVCFC